MSAKHTQADWVACEHGDYGDNNGQCIAIVGGGMRIALVLGRNTPETHANAALIAAAPDLLEALESLLAAQIDPLGIKAARACKAAAAAISKAKNEH
jgi:hypothetical protein